MVRLLLWALALSCLAQAQWMNIGFTPYQRSVDSRRSLASTGGVRSLRDRIIRRLWGESPHCSEKTSMQRGPSRSGKSIGTYGNEVVLRFNISSIEEATALAKTANNLFLDVWEFTAEWADIRVTEDALPSLLGLLPQSLQTSYITLIPDLTKAIYESYPKPNISLPEFPSFRFQQIPNSRPSSSSSPDFFFGDYQPLSVIHPWMRLISGLFPTHVRLINIGTTYEGRDILAFRVGVHPSNAEQPSGSRKTIIVSGGSHAREWISTASVNYAAFSMISAYGKSRDITKLMEEFDWIFIPTLNPDGYVYTWESDRLWRKNRQETDLRFCKGIDLDRSYSYQWDGESTQGNPCSESFAGNSPLEAIESRRLVDWVKTEAENNNASFVGFLDFHSYSQQVLYPFSYSCIQTPPTLENLEELGLGLAKAIKQAENKNYGVTSACEGSVTTQTRTRRETGLWPRLESGGGSALDYMYHEMEIKYSYQIKLRDRGSYGFLLPSKNIVPSGNEVFGALTYFGAYLLGNKGIERMDDSPSSEGVVVLRKMEETDIEADEEPNGKPDIVEL